MFRMIGKFFKYLFIASFLFAFISIVTGGGQSGTSSSPKGKPQSAPQQQQVSYAPADVATMLQELQNNAAAASKRYKGQYLKVSGVLGTIDSDMKYIAIVPNEYSIQSVLCNLKRNDKAQENYVMNASRGQWVTAYGRITDVGEIMGYTMDVDKFE